MSCHFGEYILENNPVVEKYLQRPLQQPALLSLAGKCFVVREGRVDCGLLRGIQPGEAFERNGMWCSHSGERRVSAWLGRWLSV